jgi:Oxidoreductase family, NAD-binding Rossmann fold
MGRCWQMMILMRYLYARQIVYMQK